MSPDPGSDRALDKAVVEIILREQFPELAAVPVRYVAEGYDHQMFEAGDFMFRFPKRAQVVAWSLREAAFMPAIAAVIGVPVPVFEKIGRPSEVFPYPFVGYRRIPGIAVDEVDEFDTADVAKSLGAALTRLHSIDPAVIPPDPEEDEAGAGFRDHGVDVLAVLPVDIRADAAGFLRNEIPCPPFPGPARVVHSDLLPEHVLVDPATGRLTGIIDFADLGVGDPASDFAGMEAMGGWEFVRLAMDAYELPADARFADRIVWRTRRLQLGELVYALLADEDVEEHVELVIEAFSGGLSGPGA